MDKLFNALEPHLEELGAFQAQQFKEQKDPALAIQRAIPPRAPRAIVPLGTRGPTTVFTHRGLPGLAEAFSEGRSPHQFTPMPGAHQAVS